MKGKNIIVNASPLIYLAKIRELEILDRLFDKVYVPIYVYGETQEPLRRDKKAEDAMRIRTSKFLIIEVPTREEENLAKKIQKEQNLALGESYVIALYKTRRIDYTLFADIEASERARKLEAIVLDPLDIGKMIYKETEFKNYLLKLAYSANYITKEIEKELLKL